MSAMISNRITNSPVFKFLIVGGISTLVNYSVYALLFTVFGYTYSIAFVAGFLSGVAFGYYFNKRWAFGKQEASSIRLLLSYFVVYALSMIAGILVLKFLVTGMQVHPLIANFFTIVLTTCTNFVGLRYLVFR
ncbi:GtrA family protein [Rhizobium sp. SA279]|jgi:putative flippase GtrA